MSSNQKTSQPLPVGVVGCGRMGRLHARVYSQMPSVKLVGVVDRQMDLASSTASDYGTVACPSIEELVPQVRAVTIAVPTEHHLKIAEPFLSRGVACLIEKPLAKSSVEGRAIMDLARKHGALVQVGHIERFNPAIRSMQRMHIEPRFMEVTRISPLTFRSIDVGVVLDMMIHDIDIVLKLANSTPAQVDAVGVSVLGGPEDICNARVRFANGCVANLTASRLALKTERKLRVFSKDAYVSIDYQKKYGIVARRSGNLETLQAAVNKIRTGEITDISELNFAELVQVEELQIDDTEPLRAELDSFVDAVRGTSDNPVPVEHGLAAVELAERIVEAIGDSKL